MSTAPEGHPNTKFEPHFLDIYDGDLVAFKSLYTNLFMSCDWYGTLSVNGPRINGGNDFEYFYVYTAGERNQYITIKSKAANSFVTHTSDSEFNCRAT
jgi:hypothetical protein